MELAEIRRRYRDILEHKYPDNADGVLMRLNIIRALERELKTEFIDSYDFRRKLDSFCVHGKKIRFSDGRKLREMRKTKKWTQFDLANHLGYARQTIIRYENNSEPLSKKARIWLERQLALSEEM